MEKNKKEIIKIENEENIISDDFYLEIKLLINEARRRVVNYVNSTILFVYWSIGKMIVEKQGGEERAKYGEKVIKELSKRLTKDFGEGYDERNLRYMRYFYSSFSIWNAVRSELTWTHYRLVMRIKEKHIRDYYIEECIKSNWSTRELERVINEEKRLIEEYKLLKNNENRIYVV